MNTRKLLVSAMIAAGALGAVVVPLPAAAASFDFFFNSGHTRSDYSYGRGYDQASRFDRDGDGIPNRRDPTPDGFGPRWDRDNDGIANRFDRTPDGAVRGAVRMSDRDRDGVPDRFDNHPNNPRWR